MVILDLSKRLTDELAPFSIRVNTVAPGNIPLQRYGDSGEFTKGVCFLASGASFYVTGSTLMVDGGMVKGY